jgi:peptide/nickel transport system permease protein
MGTSTLVSAKPTREGSGCTRDGVDFREDARLDMSDLTCTEAVSGKLPTAENLGRWREWKITLTLLFSNPVGVIGISIIGIFLLMCVLGPFIAPYDPYAVQTTQSSLPPSLAHPFGTDLLGRDILSRVLHGAHISLLSGLIIVGAGTSIGVVIGLISGYASGWVGSLLMRLPDIFLAFPTLVLAISLAVTFGPSLTNALLAMSLVYWPSYARLMYGETLSIKRLDYVLFARTLNQSDVSIVTSHILPNAISPIIIQASLDFGDAILLAAVLGFLGVGAQPPSPEWGAMVAQGRNYLFNYWWMSIIPGTIIFLVTLGFNFLGDAIRDAFDPNIRRVKKAD